MLAAQSRLLFQLNKFYNDRVQTRKIGISKTVREITKIVMEVLREVEVQEPRFISSLAEINGRYEGEWKVGAQ